VEAGAVEAGAVEAGAGVEAGKGLGGCPLSHARQQPSTQPATTAVLASAAALCRLVAGAISAAIFPAVSIVLSFM
jgi:hypothetical protein